MKTKLLFFFSLLALNSCNSQSNYKKVADEIATIAQEPTNMNTGKEKYILDVPEGWTTKHKNAYGVDMYFLLAPKTKEDPNTNINVVTESMQNLSFDNYKTGMMESIKNSIPSASILAQGDMSADGIKGGWYSYTMESHEIKATLVSYIFPKNGIAYIITAGTQDKDAVRYRNTFDLVAKSLKFDK